MNMLSNALKFTNQGWIKVTLDMEDLPVKQRTLTKNKSSNNPNKESAEQKSVVKNVRFEEINEEIESKQIDVNLKIQKKLVITIEDTGVGIKEQDLSKLFKYFGKLKDQHNINKKGTGLGLYISKRIVETMGGEISIKSQFGKGTKFTMFVIVQVNHDKSSGQSVNNDLPIKRILNNSMPSMQTIKGTSNKIGKQTELEIERLKSSNQSLMAIQTNYLQGGLFGNNSLDFITKK